MQKISFELVAIYNHWFCTVTFKNRNSLKNRISISSFSKNIISHASTEENLSAGMFLNPTGWTLMHMILHLRNAVHIESLKAICKYNFKKLKLFSWDSSGFLCWKSALLFGIHLAASDSNGHSKMFPKIYLELHFRSCISQYIRSNQTLLKVANCRFNLFFTTIKISVFKQLPLIKVFMPASFSHFTVFHSSHLLLNHQ